MVWVFLYLPSLGLLEQRLSLPHLALNGQHMGLLGAIGKLPEFILRLVDEIDRVVRPFQRSSQFTAYKQEIVQIVIVPSRLLLIFKIQVQSNSALKRSLGFLEPAQRPQACL